MTWAAKIETTVISILAAPDLVKLCIRIVGLELGATLHLWLHNEKSMRAKNNRQLLGILKDIRM
jgi:hypothetical protein